MINTCRRPRFVLYSLLAIAAFSIFLACTPLGFPYRPKTSGQRVAYLVSESYLMITIIYMPNFSKYETNSLSMMEASARMSQVICLVFRIAVGKPHTLP